MSETSTVSEIVTLTRAEWNALQDQLDELSDQLAAKRSEERLATLGADEMRRLSYTAEETRRIVLEDVAPLTIWRDRAGLSQRALATAAKVSPSYLAEIERGKKPGSVAALASLAAVLKVPMEHLVATEAR